MNTLKLPPAITFLLQGTLWYDCIFFGFLCLPSHKIYENENDSPLITNKKYKQILVFNTLNQGIKNNWKNYFTGKRRWGHTPAFCSTSSQVTYGYRYLGQLILYYSSTVRSLRDMELLIISIQTWRRIWIVSAHLLKCKWHINLEAKSLIMYNLQDENIHRNLI